MTVSLIAMTHAGEVLITRDEDGLLRRHDQLRRGESVLISAREAEAAISRYHLDRVGTTYSDYHELAEAVRARIPRIEVRPEIFSVGPTTVRLLLPELRAWAIDHDRRNAAWMAGTRLLTDPVIASDPELVMEITSAIFESAENADYGYITGEVSERQRTMLSYFTAPEDQAA